MYSPHDPPAYLCTMTAEQDERHEPSAFALVRRTPEMTTAIAEAYDQLSRGMPGEIEIPIVLPLFPARREASLAKSTVPNARALQCTLNVLTMIDDRHSVAVGDRVCAAFAMLTTTRPANAVLIVSRHRPPRIRTCVRGGRTRYVSAPIQQLAPPSWTQRPTCGPLRLVAQEHHRA